MFYFMYLKASLQEEVHGLHQIAKEGMVQKQLFLI